MTEPLDTDYGIDLNESESEEIGWEKEAQSIVREFKSCVNYIAASDKLPSTDSRVYFNLETKEGGKFCVELTASGFRICSQKFDDPGENIDEQALSSEQSELSENQGDVQGKRFYETMNALLDKLSPLYRISFTNQLIDRLSRQCNEDSKI